MCSVFFYFRLTNVSILHSGEFEFTFSYHYFFLYLCLLYPRCDIWHFSSYQGFIQCTSNCRTKPYFVLFFNLQVCLARRLSQSWSLEHTSLEHVALCVSEFLQKSLSLQHNFVDLIVCDLSWRQNSVEETINIQVNLSLQCFTTTCCWNLSPSNLFEGIRPELQKPLWSTLKLAYFVKIPKASSQFLWDICLFCVIAITCCCLVNFRLYQQLSNHWAAMKPRLTNIQSHKE